MNYLFTYANAALAIPAMCHYFHTGDDIGDLCSRSILHSPQEINITTLQIPFGLYILSTRFEDGTIKGEVKIKL